MSVSQDFVEQCLNHLKEPENRHLLEDYVLNPCLDYVYDHLFIHLSQRFFPYLRVLSGLYILIIILLIAIIYLIVKKS